MKPRILVIDDDPKLTALVRIMLERLGGFQVREENRSYAALDTAREYQPDLIILDVQMPGLDGGDVAAEFKADPLLNSTPVIFLTSLVEKAGFAGENRILPRPFNPQDLIRTVNHLLPVPLAA